MLEKKSFSTVENRPATQHATHSAKATPADFGKPDSPVRERMAQNMKAAHLGKPVPRDRAR